MTKRRPNWSLWQGRFEQIERDLASWAQEPITIGFDASGTDLFSILEQAWSYPKRCGDLSAAIHRLLGDGRVVPASIIARSLIETIGMGCLFLHDMSRLIAAGDLVRLETRLRQYFVGQKGGAAAPVHVMDAIRHLKKLDKAYVSYLDRKYSVFTKVFTALQERAEQDSPLGNNFYELISVSATYDLLSEVSHPNSMGTNFLYPDPVNADEQLDRALEKFHFFSHLAIWHGHHLLSEWNRNADLSERFRVTFFPHREVL